jgi:hypothetical protein
VQTASAPCRNIAPKIIRRPGPSSVRCLGPASGPQLAGRGAAIGAGAGAGLGGISGAQADAQCRQIAMQNFMQLMAQQAEAQRAAAAQGQAAQLQATAYQSVEYYTPPPKEGQKPVRHKITQTNNYTNPVTKENCGAYSVVSFGDDNKESVTGTGRVCTGADGKPREA